jgi:hypothetical protein
MGGTLNFLFEYDEYIKNIDKLTNNDDLIIYEKFKIHKIVEGLIYTYPQQNSINIINKKYKELNCNIEPDGEIYIEGYFKELKNYLPIFNNLGYYISKLTSDGEKWEQEYTNDSKPIALFLEPKYDIKIINIPNILYHATHNIYDKRIEKIGLIPKSKNKVSNHPDRIYLTDNLQIAITFGKLQYGQDYSIYKIDTNGLNINLYEDINLKNNGFYTLNNISSKYIEKI